VTVQQITLHYAHRIFFTEGVFAFGNETLLRALRDEGGAAAARARRVLVVVEAAVAYRHRALLGEIEAWFAREAAEFVLSVPPLVLEGGEPCKNHWPNVEQVWAAIHDAKIDRHSFVLAIGGGALLDLVGFASATAHRGVRHVRLPTTTLSQGDGGVGVKNGVNFFGKKNWTGSFAVPWAVVNDFAFLESLPASIRREGIIEAIKVALIRDAAFFEEMAGQVEGLRALDSAVLRRVIERSAALHVKHICTGGDAFELGSARPLDFGHWVAHKLEPLTEFRLSHGRAVAIGMAVDLLYARNVGMLSAADAERILAVIRGVGFSLWVDELAARDSEDGAWVVLRGLEDFREHLGGELTITLVTAPGHAHEVHTMDPPAILAAIEELRTRFAEE
jgi:3-dehydroquinate synthase